MKIQAISLWQPHASLVAAKVKHFETRHWATNYRGPLLICAAKRPIVLHSIEDDFFRSIPVMNALMGIPELGLTRPLGTRYINREMLPYGKAVAIVDLTDCISTNLMSGLLRELGSVFGDLRPGRYAWRLENHRRIVEPFPVVGRQGFFTVEVDMNNLKLA